MRTFRIDGTNKTIANLDMNDSIDISNIRDDVTDSSAVVNKKCVDPNHMPPSGHQKDVF